MSGSGPGSKHQAPGGSQELVQFSTIIGDLPEFSEKPTFTEWFGATLASRVLWFICGLAVLFLGAWWFTRPALADVRSVLGPSALPKDVLETLRSLRVDHFDQFKDLFQVIVLSGLVPLFTLVAGYTFGAKQKEKEG